MYKIQSVSRINNKLFINHPNAKDEVIKSMLIDFAHEMYKNNCFELTETNLTPQLSLPSSGMDEHEVRIKAFVMTPHELNQAIQTLKLIKSALPEHMKGYCDSIYTILTQQPV